MLGVAEWFLLEKRIAFIEEFVSLTIASQIDIC